MSKSKHKNCWCHVKINALKFALKEAIKQKDLKLDKEIKALLQKLLEDFPDI